MNNLVTFGCSLTYGHGLPDCLSTDFRDLPPPSNLAWPKLLADTLNLNCINCSAPGASNLEILHTILNYKFLPNDTIFVFWTYTSRDTVFHKDRITKLGGWQEPEVLKNWLELHNDYDLAIRSWIAIHHAYQYLKSLNLKFYFINIDLPSIDENWSKEIQFLKSKIETIPRAPDGLHPGVKCHHRFIKNILKELSTDFQIS